MSLLPEHTAATHVSRLLDAANEAGLPVFWRSITPEQAKRYLLSSLTLEEVLEMDHDTVDQSISLWMSEDDGRTWGPWWMAKVIVAQKQADWEKVKDDERKMASENELAKTIADGRQWNKEIDAKKRRFEKWKSGLSVVDARNITNKWLKKLQDGNKPLYKAPPTGLILKWEFESKE